MKLDYKNPNTCYKISFVILKFSGYLFYSIKTNEDNSIEFYQGWSDYAIFLFSFLVTLWTFFRGATNNLSLKLQSPALNLGMPILWEAFIISMLITKVISVTRGRSSFNILMNFKWFDEQVSEDSTEFKETCFVKIQVIFRCSD